MPRNYDFHAQPTKHQFNMENLIMLRVNTGVACLFALSFLISMNVSAFESTDEQIDHYLGILDSNDADAKILMLKRLQWSGLSNPRLYNHIEQQLLSKVFMGSLKKVDANIVSHQIRALGYSGNAAYRETLQQVVGESSRSQHVRHARQAIIQQEQFSRWIKLISESDIDTKGKNIEISNYMRMLDTDNVLVQRLAARAIFHENIRDYDLIALCANELSNLYLLDALDGEGQDTAAWLSKAIGQSGFSDFNELLNDVVENTPYTKLRKHTLKYVQ